MLEIKESFSARLNKALEHNNMKPADLARKSGISEATISQYRSGYSKPKDQRLVLLANILDVNPSWLMGLDVPMERPSVIKQLEELAKDKIQHDRLMEYWGKLNEEGKQAAIVQLRLLTMMPEFTDSKREP